MIKLKKLFYKLIKKSPASMELVQYWKTKESVQAKVLKAKEGHLIMQLEGEKYPIQGFPRGYLLFGSLSKLKHEIKNQVFNESWRKLEEGIADEEIISDIKKTLFISIANLAEKTKYDRVPYTAMCPSVKEIYRAWTKVSPETSVLRDYLCFILQEDDSYRMRVQWLYTFLKPRKWIPWNPIKSFEFALKMLEHAEVIEDMKERIRLLRRMLLLVLKDESIRNKFERLFREIDWRKVKLTKADKYHFRGKYFKVDLDVLEY